jgi:GGDEF domain-containing protein
MSDQESARITAFAETYPGEHHPRADRLNDREIFLTASIGLAPDPQTQLSEEIIKDAGFAMYHSKRIAATARRPQAGDAPARPTV